MRSIRYLVPALAIAVPASASGQPMPVKSTVEPFDGQEAWDVLSEFGHCFAKHERTDAIQFVSTKPDSIEEAKAYKKIISDQNQPCLGYASELRAPYKMFRGVVAQGLYESGAPVPPSLVVAVAPTSAQVRNFMDAAICFAATHRDQVRKLLATTHLGTKAEKTAVDELGKDFRSCIPANGRSIEISASLARLRLAEAMWRLGETPRGSAQQ